MLVLLGAVIAYFSIDEWLINYAYCSDISMLPFVTATNAALASAYITIDMQSHKTVQANPVNPLRYE